MFHVMVVENHDERHLSTAIWLFPLYLLAINIFVLPIALGGLMHFPSGTVDADTFVLTLPMSAEDWRRVFIGSAMDVDIDGASRVLIAPELREWAGLERDVLLVGMGSRFELWDKVRHDAHEATVLAAGMPDVLRDHVM